MTTYKHLTSHTDVANKDRITNDPDYKFKVRVFKDGKITELDAAQVQLWDKEFAKKFSSKLRDGGDTWDSDLIELGHDKEYIKKAVPIILNTLENPNFTWVKDPGKKNGIDRPLQEKEVKGKRQVLFDLHEDASGGHLHLKVFRYAIDEQTNSIEDAPMYVADVQRKVLAQINKELIENGLAPLGSIQNALPTGNQKTSQETKIQANEILKIEDEDETEQVLDSIIEDVKYNDSAIDVALKADMYELQKIIEAAKTKKAEILQKQKALEVVNENRQLKYQLKELEVKANELTDKLEVTEENVEKLTADLHKTSTEKVELEEQLTETKQSVEELENINTELSTEKEQLEISISHLTEENNAYVEQVKVIPSLKRANEELKEKLEAAQKEAKLKDENIALKDEKIALMESRFKELESKIKTLEETNTKQEKFLEEKEKEVSLFRDLIDHIEDRLSSAGEVLQSFAARIKNTAAKGVFSSFREQNQRVAAAALQIDKDSEEAKRRIEELRKQFKDTAKAMTEASKPATDNSNTQKPNKP